MSKAAEPVQEFDEARFQALLDLAGPATAHELASRLDEDLTVVADALTQAERAADRQQLRAQSHVLLAIAGTIGANRLYHLSKRLNGQVRTPDSAPVAELLGEIHVLLGRLITRVRSARLQLARSQLARSQLAGP